MKIAVLCLQGAFIEHINTLRKINKNIEIIEIRTKEDSKKDFSGLILPGGESTVMLKLMKDLGIYDTLKEKIENGLPTFGTCAGLILLSKHIENQDENLFGVLDILVRRNAYGRQLSSFFTYNTFDGIHVPMVFIRGPQVVEIYDKSIKVISTVDNNIVAIRKENIIATSYHPELTEDLKVHEYFLNLIKGA